MTERPYRDVRVLLVDDEPIVCRAVPIALRRLGFVVTACGTGEEALAEIEARDHDIVITDVVLGDVDGIEILERVKARSPGTPVIIITAFATRDLARRAMARGAFDFIAKPFAASEIRAKASLAAESLGRRPD